MDYVGEILLGGARPHHGAAPLPAHIEAAGKAPQQAREVRAQGREAGRVPSPEIARLATQWPRWHRVASGHADRTAPPADVAPRAQLESHVAIDADGSEAHGLVQPHARVVGKRDARISVAESLVFEKPQQFGVEGFADPAAAGLGAHVARDIRCPLVRRTLAVLILIG